MTELLQPKAMLFLTQAIAFSVLSFIFYMYYRTFERRYVKYWLLGLTSITLGYYVIALTPLISSEFSNAVSQLVVSASFKLTQFVALLFLFVGIYNARSNFKPSISQFVIAILSLAAFTVMTSSLYAFDDQQTFNHFYLTVSLPSFIFGCCFIGLSFFLAVDKKRHFSSTLLLCFALVIGLRYLSHSFLSILALTEQWFRQLEQVLLYFDVAAQIVLGFILLVWMQGAERFAAINAINRAQYLGKHDSLTGALNREQVMARLSEVMVTTLKARTKLAVFLIDIKQFKFINDTYGLKVGDYILGEIANRLTNSVFLPQAVGRLSGDSFMFVMEFEQLSHVDRATKHIHELINKAFIYNQQDIHIQASVGYCFYPEHASNAEDLLQKANLALHHAETNHLASVAFEDGMQAQGRHLLIMEKQLKAALANDEFVLYFQPQLNLLTNKLEGVEALVRWQHPEKGLLLPVHFLADMEAIGLHNEFDRYILAKACQYNAKWFELYHRRIVVAVNITAVEFQDSQLVTNIQSLLQEYNLPPKYLELEITENVVMTDIEQAMNTIVKLQNMGIKVSIDDFGTGYSSLAYLRKLPIDKIKIDRSFITEVASNDSDLTIVKSMVELSHGLGKRVLAEGVETEEQLNVLRHLGCDAVQGYYINKPIPDEQLQQYFTKPS
ncbi:EAL domain-containing protein [Litorilituus sediminis]|uniref:EAL domain-containing protein n=1 Tax=Litorilituus sediminis TaxID=718192 RepID=A0A4P6P6L3_9GAMM|nr:EAL domain-containing protein [Litorilituus sediminis]QBG36668.1 EAL domain-containing protein [Litorilituus sediminis]